MLCGSSSYIHLGREFIRKQNNLEKEPCAYWQFSVQSPCTLFLFKTQGYSLETEQFHKCIIYIPSNYNYTNAMLGKSKQNTECCRNIESVFIYVFLWEYKMGSSYQEHKINLSAKRQFTLKVNNIEKPFTNSIMFSLLDSH